MIKFILIIFLGFATLRADTSYIRINDGWSTNIENRFSGQLLEEKHYIPNSNDSILTTIYKNSRLLFASGEKGIAKWSIDDKNSWEVKSDSSGYWNFVSHQKLDAKYGWYQILSSIPMTGSANFLVHNPVNHIGIISDIDDTIVSTNVNQKRQFLKNSLAIPSSNRETIVGMSSLYKKIISINKDPASSPIFYISASPQSFSDNLRVFLLKNDFPRGILMLKQTTISVSLLNQQSYKVDSISSIFRAFPNTKFYLIGDDGEKDPEAYNRIQKLFPSQIIKILIRKVNPDKNRTKFPLQKYI